MILVDTSIWIDYMRRKNEVLSDLLSKTRILIHPFVLGELALCGTRQDVIENLRKLPWAKVATVDEALELIQCRHIAGRGVGYVDAHLLASALLTGDADVWTLDKSLRAVAAHLGILAEVD